MATSKKQREFIVDYWFRIFVGSEIAIDDIVKIAMEYGAPYERFIPSLAYGDFKIEDNGNVINFEANTDCQAFGEITAIPDKKYHWKLKVIKSAGSLNIGVINADTDVKEIEEEYFWESEDGYSYHAGSGNIWNDGRQVHDVDDDDYQKCKCEDNDIIHIWLDLREYKFFFTRNDSNKDETVNVTLQMDYKLAICCAQFSGPAKIQIISFEILD